MVGAGLPFLGAGNDFPGFDDAGGGFEQTGLEGCNGVGGVTDMLELASVQSEGAARGCREGGGHDECELGWPCGIGNE